MGSSSWTSSTRINFDLHTSTSSTAEWRSWVPVLKHHQHNQAKVSGCWHSGVTPHTHVLQDGSIILLLLCSQHHAKPMCLLTTPQPKCVVAVAASDQQDAHRSPGAGASFHKHVSGQESQAGEVSSMLSASAVSRQNSMAPGAAAGQLKSCLRSDDGAGCPAASKGVGNTTADTAQAGKIKRGGYMVRIR